MTYAAITAEELRLLATSKQSGLSTQIYIALRSFAWTKDDVFPSIKKISSLLGDAYCRTSIHKALKKLQDAGLIKINERTSKSRFVLLARKVALAAKQAVKECFQMETTNVEKWKQEDRNRKKKNKKINKKRTYQRFKRRRTNVSQVQKSQKNQPPKIKPLTDEIGQTCNLVIQMSIGLMGTHDSKYEHYSCRGITKARLIEAKQHFKKILETPAQMRNEDEFMDEQLNSFLQAIYEWCDWLEKVKC